MTKEIENGRRYLHNVHVTEGVYISNNQLNIIGQQNPRPLVFEYVQFDKNLTVHNASLGEGIYLHDAVIAGDLTIEGNTTYIEKTQYTRPFAIQLTRVTVEGRIEMQFTNVGTKGKPDFDRGIQIENCTFHLFFMRSLRFPPVTSHPDPKA